MMSWDAKEQRHHSRRSLLCWTLFPACSTSRRCPEMSLNYKTGGPAFYTVRRAHIPAGNYYVGPYPQQYTCSSSTATTPSPSRTSDDEGVGLVRNKRSRRSLPSPRKIKRSPSFDARVLMQIERTRSSQFFANGSLTDSHATHSAAIP